MKRIDLGARIDVTSRLSSQRARKVLSEIFNSDLDLITFSRHARDQIKIRALSSVDVINVLKAGKILNDPEYENGTWRYRVESLMITVVIAFRRPNHLIVVTAWRNS